MTGPRDPQRPFERDAFFDEPGIVGARWWNRAFQAEVEATRRQAMKTMALFGAGAAAVLALGVGGVVAVVQSGGEPRLRKAVDVQRKIGWNAGAFETPLSATSSVPLPAGALGRVAATLKPRRYAPFYVGTQVEAPYAKPTSPLSGVPRMDLGAQLRRNRTPALDSDMRAGAELARVFGASGVQALVVIDAPGPRSAAFAAGAATTFEPVLVLDNWPHPAGVVNAQQTLGTLGAYEPELSAAVGRRGPTPPPLFVLDRDRTPPLTNPEAQFDNRYFATLPRADVARKWGFQRALLIVEAVSKLPGSGDVAAYFAEYVAAGLDARVIGLDLFDWDGRYAGGKVSLFHHIPWAPIPAGSWERRELADAYKTWRPGAVPGLSPATAKPDFGKVIVYERDGEIVGIDGFGGSIDRASGGWGG